MANLEINDAFAPSRVAGVRKPCSFPRHEPKPTSTGGAPESRRSARARARKPVHVPETAVGVTLTLVTCYPAAPVTAIADMWVGGGWWRGEGDGDSPLRCGEQDRIRIVVAGRSGSARMSAWDLVEGRQLLEVDKRDECGMTRASARPPVPSEQLKLVSFVGLLVSESVTPVSNAWVDLQALALARVDSRRRCTLPHML